MLSIYVCVCVCLCILNQFELKMTVHKDTFRKMPPTMQGITWSDTFPTHSSVCVCGHSHRRPALPTQVAVLSYLKGAIPKVALPHSNPKQNRLRMCRSQSLEAARSDYEWTLIVWY
uniref:Secreted protein n=1 Tax=Anopheles funestus TaxID=62324 RepID=A0A182S1T3_ANOFN